MAAKRIILKKGNIYRIPIGKDEVCFMQYLTDDRHQLGGAVIRVFWKRYKAADKPSVEEIVAGPVDFYRHVMIKRGIWLGYWEKYGHSDDLDALCSSLGFSKTQYGVYYKETGNGTIATLSFKCSPYKLRRFITAERRIRLTVTVGVVNKRIYDVYDKYSEYNHEEKSRKKFRLPDETVITHIGRLMPQRELAEWDVTKKTDLDGLCGELNESIIKYAYPFIDHLSDFENVAEAVRSGEYASPINNNILMSIISYLQGNKAEAMEYHQARYGEGFLCHESEYDEKFDKNFRELITSWK